MEAEERLPTCSERHPGRAEAPRDWRSGSGKSGAPGPAGRPHGRQRGWCGQEEGVKLRGQGPAASLGGRGEGCLCKRCGRAWLIITSGSMYATPKWSPGRSRGGWSRSVTHWSAQGSKGKDERRPSSAVHSPGPEASASPRSASCVQRGAHAGSVQRALWLGRPMTALQRDSEAGFSAGVCAQ